MINFQIQPDLLFDQLYYYLLGYYFQDTIIQQILD